MLGMTEVRRVERSFISNSNLISLLSLSSSSLVTLSLSLISHLAQDWFLHLLLPPLYLSLLLLGSANPPSLRLHVFFITQQHVLPLSHQTRIDCNTIS